MGVFTHGDMSVEGKWNNGILEGKVIVKILNEPPLNGTVKDNNMITFGEVYCPPLMLPPTLLYLTIDI